MRFGFVLKGGWFGSACITGGVTGFVSPGITTKYISATLASVDGVSTCRVVGAGVVVRAEVGAAVVPVVAAGRNAITSNPAIAFVGVKLLTAVDNC